MYLMSAEREVMLLRLPSACCGKSSTGQLRMMNVQYVRLVEGHPLPVACWGLVVAITDIGLLWQAFYCA